MDEQKKYDVIVVGGGITGLATAYFAAKAGKKVAILEASKNIGGLLNTFEIGGNQLEYYYHHFFTHDAELNWLIKDLGIEEKLFFKKTTMGVFRNNKIYNFNSPKDLISFSPINWMDKIKFGFSTIYLGKMAKWQNSEHISAMQWLKKWAGKSTTTSLWAPLLKIKFGPFADVVPLSWMVGRMRQRMGSRKNGDERLGYLQGSLKTLLDALLEKLNFYNVDIFTTTAIDKIEINNHQIDYLVGNEKQFFAEKYVMTIPSIYLFPLLKNQANDLAMQMEKIKYFSAMCVILEMKKPLSEIYWLNIAEDNFPFGGIIEHTNFIPASEYQGKYIAYLSRYFAEDEEIAKMNDEEIKKLMLEKLPQIFPNFSTEDLINVHLFKTKTGATVCDLNFSEKILPCKTPIKNMYLANMSHVYPDERSTNNSIRVAAEACKVMEIDTTFVPYHQSLAAKIGF